MDKLKCESKGENNERKISWGMFPNSQHLGVEGCVGDSGWGLGRMTNESIIHINQTTSWLVHS